MAITRFNSGKQSDQIVIEQDILWINSLKEEYGNNLLGAMVSGIQASQVNAQTAQRIAIRTMLEGLIMERHPNYYTEYKSKGGDVEYLQYATECFKQVRAMFVQQQY